MLARPVIRLPSPSLVLAAACSLGAVAAAQSGAEPASASTAVPRPAAAACAVPLQFVPNRGQWDAAVRFAAVGNTAGWLHDDGFTLRYERWSAPAASAAPRQQSGCVVRTHFLAATPPSFAPMDELPTHHHFLRGRDASRWRRDVPAFGRLAMRSVYPGIDVLFRPLGSGAVGAFEYDLLLAPGADLQRFVARCDGIESLSIDRDGALCARLATPDGPAELRQQAPIAWQDTPTGRRPLRVAFRLVDATSYGFVAADLDPALPAVVDPGVVWGTLLGGGATDSVRALRWVRGEAVWAAGWSGSTDFPTTPGAFRTTGGADAFVARLRENGAELLDATYLGGTDSDEIRGLDLGPGNTVTVVGFTHSVDFPSTPGALSSTYSGSSPFLDIGDAFVARLDATCSTLLASTYLGGLYDDIAEAVDVDAQGNATVVGWTSSPNFPVTPGCFQPSLGGIPGIQSDGFIAKVAANAQSLLWSTHLGGGTAEQLLAVDRDPTTGDVLVAGWSLGANFPTTPGAYRPSSIGGLDGVITRLTGNGSGLSFSTFVGGLGGDVMQAVRVDPSDASIWVGGFSDSSDFPTTAGAPQSAPGGQSDAVLLRFSANGSTLAFATLLGGVGAEKLRGLDLSPVGVVVVGEAGAGFPVTPGAPQTGFAGGNLDGFVSLFTDRGATLAWSSYLGGADQDSFSCVQLDAGGLAVVGGWTFSADVPIGTGGYQTVRRGAEDGVVMQFDVVNGLARGLEVTNGGSAAPVFGDSGPKDLLVATLRNVSERQLAVDAVRVLVAGTGDAAARVTALRVLRSDPAQPGLPAVQIAGPLAIAGDDRELDIALADCILVPGAVATLTVVAEVTGVAGAPIEVAAAIVDASAWSLRAFGAGAGPAVAVEGSGRVEGALHVLGALSGDADGDRALTVVDVRRLVVRVGDSDAAIDCDGLAPLTPAAASAVREAVLGRVTVFAVPPQWQRGTWQTLRLLAPNPRAMAATLGGIPLRVGRTTPRELTLQATAAHAAGAQPLVVTLDGRVVFTATVEVQ